MSNIITLISKSKDGISIVNITKKLQINRSTLRHYLKKLKAERKIYYENKNDIQGRPVFVHINKDTYKKEWEDMKNLAKEYKEKMKKDKITNKILSFLSNKKRATQEEIVNYVESLKLDEMYISKTLSSLNYLKSCNFVIDEWRISK